MRKLSLAINKYSTILIKAVCLGLIFTYQFTLAFIVGGRCRFNPSCSNYAKQAFIEFPPHKAFVLTFKRLIKCHPWGPYGEDPPPSQSQK